MKKKILIYLLGGIGDNLMALPACRMIRDNFPGHELHLLNISVLNSLAQQALYEHDPLFAERTFYHNGTRFAYYWHFLTALLKHRYSAMYCFSNYRPKLLMTMFRLLHGGPAMFCNSEDKTENIMTAEGYLLRLERSGLKRTDHLFEFPNTPAENSAAQELADRLCGVPRKSMIAFGIGGGEEACRWPLSRYEELIGRLLRQYDFLPVYIGDGREREAAEALRKKYGGFFLYDTSCRSLRQTIAFLRLCLCYAGNDTGSMHLAATSGIPCAGIFPAHDLPPLACHPFSRDSFILRHDLECSGCALRVCRFGSPARCLDAISVDAVFDALTRWKVFQSLPVRSAAVPHGSR